MYLLKHLADPPAANEGVGVEYRLACSGEFYRANVENADWRKSDATRLLLTGGAFRLSVVSRPFETYPQELCLRFNAKHVTESGNAPFAYSTTFLPDAEIAEDICAIITLLSRRLVSVIGKTREIHTDDLSKNYYDGHLPMPILTAPPPKAWTRRPGTVTTSIKGTTFQSNDPPPVAVDDQALATFLRKLPHMDSSDDIAYAAKLYMSALELIETRPDTAYLALVSVIETLSSIELRDYTPSEADRIELHKKLYQKALQGGLSVELSNELALMASEGNHWIGRKFKKFCLDHCATEDLSQRDPVYLLPEMLLPKLEGLGKTLTKIYDARSKHLHGGRPFPRGIGLGMSTWIPARDFGAVFAGPQIPPVPWFERVVSIAARKYLLGGDTAPFV